MVGGILAVDALAAQDVPGVHGVDALVVVQRPAAQVPEAQQRPQDDNRHEQRRSPSSRGSPRIWSGPARTASSLWSGLHHRHPSIRCSLERGRNHDQCFMYTTASRACDGTQGHAVRQPVPQAGIGHHHRHPDWIPPGTSGPRSRRRRSARRYRSLFVTITTGVLAAAVTPASVTCRYSRRYHSAGYASDGSRVMPMPDSPAKRARPPDRWPVSASPRRSARGPAARVSLG